ncbi:unnamed protein product [Camellia sinensis]
MISTLHKEERKKQMFKDKSPGVKILWIWTIGTAAILVTNVVRTRLKDMEKVMNAGEERTGVDSVVVIDGSPSSREVVGDQKSSSEAGGPCESPVERRHMLTSEDGEDANEFLIEIHDLRALGTCTNESKGCSSEVRTEARLSLGSPKVAHTLLWQERFLWKITESTKLALTEIKIVSQKSEQKQGCPSEVRAETRLSLRSPSRNKAVPRKSEWMCTSTLAANGSKGCPLGVRVRVHSTLKRKILGARINEIKGCSSDPH